MTTPPHLAIYPKRKLYLHADIWREAVNRTARDNNLNTSDFVFNLIEASSYASQIKAHYRAIIATKKLNGNLP